MRPAAGLVAKQRRMVARIGGSSAFVVGRSCVVPVPTGSIGRPLFVSFNVTARPVALPSLNVIVSGATPTI